MPNNNTTLRQRQMVARRRQQGMTIVEIMIVLVIVGMVASGAAVAAYSSYERAQAKTTKTDAQAVRSAVTMFVVDNRRTCPKVEDLINGKYLDASKSSTDAWGQDFQIECEGGEITVTSAGSDGQFGTEDDIQ